MTVKFTHAVPGLRAVIGTSRELNETLRYLVEENRLEQLAAVNALIQALSTAGKFVDEYRVSE